MRNVDTNITFCKLSRFIVTVGLIAITTELTFHAKRTGNRQFCPKSKRQVNLEDPW